MQKESFRPKNRRINRIPNRRGRILRLESDMFYTVTTIVSTKLYTEE